MLNQKRRKNVRNVAIIAHVDHGKTTLIDALLKQTGAYKFKDGESTIMDSNPLEKERGMTIFSKNASFLYKGVQFNIVDTPGHADFGSEVERILKRVEVDSAEAGDIVSIAGINDVKVGETLALIDNPQALPKIKIDEPTLSMVFSHNTSPLAGKDGGRFLTPRYIRERGEIFINPGDDVYEGMIIGVNNKNHDLVVNTLRGKRLTNTRAARSDDAITLIPPREITLEFAMAFIEDDELVEITPKNIRLRKRYLTKNERKSKKRVSE